PDEHESYGEQCHQNRRAQRDAHTDRSRKVTTRPRAPLRLVGRTRLLRGTLRVLGTVTLGCCLVRTHRRHQTSRSSASLCLISSSILFVCSSVRFCSSRSALVTSSSLTSPSLP